MRRMEKREWAHKMRLKQEETKVPRVDDIVADPMPIE